MSGGRRARRARRGRRGSEELQLCLLSSEAPGQDLPALPPDVLDSRYWQLSCWSKARVRISLFEDEGQHRKKEISGYCITSYLQKFYFVELYFVQYHTL